MLSTYSYQAVIGSCFKTCIIESGGIEKIVASIETFSASCLNELGTLQTQAQTREVAYIRDNANIAKLCKIASYNNRS